MTDDQGFSLFSTLPLLGWIALLLAPLRRSVAIAFARFWAIVLCVGYVVMLAVAFSAPGGAAPDFNHLGALAKAFSNPHVMLIGWVHYLAFDLWVGTWEAEEAHRRGVPHWALVPCLALTFLAGPAGLVLFLALRSALGGRSSSSPA